MNVSGGERIGVLQVFEKVLNGGGWREVTPVAEFGWGKLVCTEGKPNKKCV